MNTSDAAFDDAARSICEVGRRAYARGWCPATSGNLSRRIDADTVAITVSGRDKGALALGDVMRMDLHGSPLSAARPSAEAPLHARLYRRDPSVGAVLHVHAPSAALERWQDAHAGARCFEYLIRGHGVYVWGRTMADGWRHLEALDHLLSLELERRRILR